MHKKITSILLVLALVFGMMSSALPVFAEGEDTYTKVSAIEDGETYVITATGMGMTATPHDGYINGNSNGNYQYSGFAGTAVTVADNKITSAVTEDMLWTAETSGNGFAFKNARNGQYLNAFYNGERDNNGVRFGESPETWIFDGSKLMHEAVSNASSSKDYYLTWDTESDVSGGFNNALPGSEANLFTIRSSGDDITFFLADIADTDVPGGDEPDIPDVSEDTFTKVTSIEAGKTYVIVAEGKGMTATPLEGYVNSNKNAYSGFAGTAVTVVSDKITSDVTEDMLWTAETSGSGFAFKNASNDQYLSAFYEKFSQGSDNRVEFSESAKTWTLDNDAKLKYSDTDRFLAWDKTSDILPNAGYTGSAELFTIRSSGNADTITFYLAELAEETCQHDWEDATCIAPKTCKVCGETEGEALDHDWEDATCTAPKTCKACGETEGTALEHDWEDATCTEPKTCKVCGETEGTALEHDWEDATCTEPKTCKVCGETEGEALDHDWEDATCTEPKTCKVCGETEGEKLEHIKSEAWSTDAESHWYACTGCGAKIDLEAHEIIEGTCAVCGYEESHEHDWEDATCTAPKTCKVCGETEGTALEHDWEDATCTAPQTCKVCGETEGVALEHDWEDATCTEPKTCKVCGETEGIALEHDWEDATCTEPKTCKVCGETEGTALEHDWEDATCDAPKTCKVCGEIEGEALGHDWNTPAAGDARTCKRCGFIEWPSLQLIITADKSAVEPTDTITYSVSLSPVGNIAGIEFQMVIPEGLTFVSGALVTGLQQTLGADACDFNNENQKVEISGMNYTSTTATPILTFKCTVDKGFTGELLMGVDTENWYFENSSDDVLEVNLANGTSKVTVTCDHSSYVELATADYLKTPADCVNKAVYYKSCELCFVASTTETFEYGEARGHDFGEWVTVTPATCVSDGLAKRTCKNDANHTEEKDITQLGHDWADATCTAPQTCKRENCTATQGTALGHDPVTDAAKAPACEKTGLTEGSHCSRCNIVLEAQNVVPALEHIWQDATDVLPELCELCGMTNNVKVQLIITADKDEAKIGDTITYTVSLGPVYKIAGIEYQIDLPEGLTFVSGSLVPGVQQTLGAGACNFNEKNQKVVIGGGMAYTSDEATPILTFTCTVDNEFFGNLLMSVDTDDWYIEDVYHVVEIELANEDSEVYVACTHPVTTAHDAVASTCVVPGYGAYTLCDKCGEVVDGSNEPLDLDPDNHSNIVTYEAVAGTCSQKGHAEYTKCEDCGAILAGSDEPTVDPHGSDRSTDEKYLKSVADCNRGAVYYMHCGECGEVNETLTFTSGSPIAHNPKDATCTEPSICTLCGATIGNALGHNWKDATYDEPKTCERCGITEGEALAKFSVSGTVTSFGSETDAITVQLTDSEGNVVHTVTVNGNNTTYSISDVIPGTYTMTVSKKGHVARAYTVTVGAANATQDATIAIIGDVNCDGSISLIDCNMAYNHYVETSAITDDYALMCADINTDGILDFDDCEMFYNYLLGI